MRRIIGITGTTSVGKSAVAVELARIMQTEIVSADSMQVYCGMNIGTAKISTEEMCGIKHHMLDVVEPNENYSSFLYQQQASVIIDNIQNVPIVVGGTGFYFDSLVYPPEFGCVDKCRRDKLRKIYEEQGLEPLRAILRQLDCDTYHQIDLNNPKRVLRAIEIAESGGKRSQGQRHSGEPRYDLKLFILERSRDSLYNQIDARVDDMIARGLIDEVRALVDRYGMCDTTAFQAIGYKEIIEYFNGAITFNEAVEKIKLNTRHYAKRQITYFKKMNAVEHINVECMSTKTIANHIENALIS